MLILHMLNNRRNPFRSVELAHLAKSITASILPALLLLLLLLVAMLLRRLVLRMPVKLRCRASRGLRFESTLWSVLVGHGSILVLSRSHVI
jgi:hypothetical protein